MKYTVLFLCLGLATFGGIMHGVDSTVFISVLNTDGVSGGSGFFVSESGLILTAAHVVDDAWVIIVYTSRGDKYMADLIRIDGVLDCALISIDEVATPCLALVDDRNFGVEICCIGAPYGLPYFPFVSCGNIGNPVVHSDFVLGLSVNLHPGQSGGPVIRKDGACIGMSIALDRRGPGIGIAIPALYLQHFLLEK